MKKVIINENIILKQEEIICIDKVYNFKIYLHNNQIFSTPNQLGENLSYKDNSKSIRKIIDRNEKLFKNKIFKCKVKSKGGAQEVYCLAYDIIIEICKLSKQKTSIKFQQSLYLYNKNSKIENNKDLNIEEKRKTVQDKQKEISNRILKIEKDRKVENESYIIFSQGEYKNKNHIIDKILNNNKSYEKYMKILNNFDYYYEKNKNLITVTNMNFSERMNKCG